MKKLVKFMGNWLSIIMGTLLVIGILIAAGMSVDSCQSLQEKLTYNLPTSE